MVWHDLIPAQMGLNGTYLLEIRPPKSLPRLSYEFYSFWEEVLANESQALMMHWKYGKKGPPLSVSIEMSFCYLAEGSPGSCGFKFGMFRASSVI